MIPADTTSGVEFERHARQESLLSVEIEIAQQEKSNLNLELRALNFTYHETFF